MTVLEALAEALNSLCDSLADNARDFRRRGLDGEAQGQEQILTRLREAMARAA